MRWVLVFKRNGNFENCHIFDRKSLEGISDRFLFANMEYKLTRLFLAVLFGLIALRMSNSQSDNSLPSENPLTGTAGVLLRDILYSVPENSAGTRSNGRRRNGRRRNDDQGLQAPDVQELLSALQNHGMNAEDGETAGAQFILQLYEKMQAGENLRQASGHRGASLRQADTVRTFTASASEAGKPEENKLVVQFHIASLSTGEVPKLAELRIKPIRHNGQGHHRGQGHHKLRVATYDEAGKLILRSTYRIPYTYDRKTGDNVYDITPIVKDVAALNEADLTVQVTMNLHRKKDGDRNKRSMGSETKENEVLLVVYSQDKVFFQHFNEMQRKLQENDNRSVDTSFLDEFGPTPESRQRRATKNDRKTKSGGRKGLCERKDMYVDFEEIGWGEWIVYPKRFNAHMCSGKCPSPVGQPFDPTNHAVMQSLMRLATKGKAAQVPRPCCVPTKLYPISMLYYEYGEIVVRHHEGMIVDNCGCR